MTLVVDASVVIKWLLSDPEREADTERATRLMEYVLAGGGRVVQPVHWLAEVGAALARLSPSTAEEDLLMLQALELSVNETSDVYLRACSLSIGLDRHLFETLYHAVALEEPEGELVTADDRYVRAAGSVGSVSRLSEWAVRH